MFLSLHGMGGGGRTCGTVGQIGPLIFFFSLSLLLSLRNVKAVVGTYQLQSLGGSCPV